MSRAFVNEDAGSDRPDLPDLPVPPGPNIVTPRGLAALRARMAERQADLAVLKARADRLDRLPEAAAERDLRWLEARLKAVVVVDPAGHDLSEVAFGLAVTVTDINGTETTYEIVGEDEADAACHRIAPNSPLARALLGQGSEIWSCGGARSGPSNWRLPGFPMRIRELFPSETGLVAQFYREAPDYWLMAECRSDPEAKARDFFTDAPPNCDPAQSDRLGLFVQQRLSGVAELSYGFPDRNDAYLGLMILGPWAQGAGHGRSFLSHCEGLARKRHCPRLYLAVIDRNRRGRAFWLREGFLPTGLVRHDQEHGYQVERLLKTL